MRPLRDVIRRRPKRILELEDGAFAVVMQQAESIHQRPGHARVLILVTKDPPEGREVVIGPLRLRKRLGQRWEEWAVYWEGPWSRLHEEIQRPSANYHAFIPDDATLRRAAELADARVAMASVRSTV
jgi:hypothetical protein